MATKVTKAKAPAKPRATARTTEPTVAKKETVAIQAAAAMPSHAEIAQLAHHYWAERGRQHGHHEQDWARAERELRNKAS